MEYTHVLFRTSKLANPRSRRDVPSGRRSENAHYVASLKIYFRPRLTAVASLIKSAQETEELRFQITPLNGVRMALKSAQETSSRHI